jgi:hypothetical protein
MALKKRLVWTMGYRPFVMGGSVHYPMGTRVPCSGPFDLGRGYSGYLATAPNGRTFVAEATTGALVGPTIEAVRKDIETGDPKLMVAQVAKATETVKKVEETTPKEFWAALKCGAVAVKGG